MTPEISLRWMNQGAEFFGKALGELAGPIVYVRASSRDNRSSLS